MIPIKNEREIAVMRRACKITAAARALAGEMVRPGVTMARTVSWYDNEYGFTCNMVRTLLYFAEISE